MKKTAFLIATIMILAPVATFAADGAATFKAKCQLCHGADGTKLAKANLAGPQVQAKSDADLVTFLTSDAKHKSKVADEATAKALVQFIRTLKK